MYAMWANVTRIPITEMTMTAVINFLSLMIT